MPLEDRGAGIRFVLDGGATSGWWDEVVSIVMGLPPLLWSSAVFASELARGFGALQIRVAWALCYVSELKLLQIGVVLGEGCRYAIRRQCLATRTVLPLSNSS